MAPNTTNDGYNKNTYFAVKELISVFFSFQSDIFSLYVYINLKPLHMWELLLLLMLWFVLKNAFIIEIKIKEN